MSIMWACLGIGLSTGGIFEEEVEELREARAMGSAAISKRE
jgi:hypothetical protein